jgi:hypothetical protein
VGGIEIMANIVITKVGNSIKVDFGVYSGTGRLEMLKSSFDARDIQRVDQYSDHLHVGMRGQSPDWEVAISGTAYLVVDSIDGVAPSSISDLYDKISALR